MKVTNSDCIKNINLKPCSFTKKHFDSGYDVFFKGQISDDDYLKYDFVTPEHVSFFKSFVSQYPNITENSILEKLNKISKMDVLEPFSKINLVEHVLVKESRGEKRDFETLISNVEYFSSNKSLSPVLVSDSAKYTLENPETDKENFNSALTFVAENASFKAPAVVMKVSKIISGSGENEKNVLMSLVQSGFSAEQIAFVSGMSKPLFEKLQTVDDVSKLSTEMQFEYFKYLSSANNKIYDVKMKTVFPAFPITKEAATEERKKLEKMFSASSPVKIDDISVLKSINNKHFSEDDSLVFGVCRSILENNIPDTGVSSKQYYSQKAFQSISELDGLGLTFEQRNKIAKIIRASGEILDKTPDFENIALSLRYKNSFDIFKEVHKNALSKNSMRWLVSLNEFLKNNTNCFIQDDFNSHKFKTMKFPDGTSNKIVEYEHNPQILLHSAGIDIAGLLPLESSKDETQKLYNANADRIFSASFLSGDDFKPFRNYGFVLNSEADDILGGFDCDLASGYDKSAGKFDVDRLKSSRSIFTYFPNLVKNKYHINDGLYRALVNKAVNGDDISKMIIKYVQKDIGSTQRLDGRKYNEFYMYNPSISAVYVYGDISDLPFEFRKFAQDNDLKILHLKSKQRS